MIEKLTGNVAVGNNIKQEVQVEINSVNIETIRETTKSECKKIKEIANRAREIVEFDNKKIDFVIASVFMLFLFTLSSSSTNKLISEISSYLLIAFILLFLYTIMIGVSAKNSLKNLISNHETDLKVAKEFLQEYTKYLPKEEAEDARTCVKITEELLSLRSKISKK